MEAEEFLTNKGIYHNVTYKTDDGKITLTQLLSEYARQKQQRSFEMGYQKGLLDAHKPND